MAGGAGFGQNDGIVPPIPSPPTPSGQPRSQITSALLRATTVLGLVALLVFPVQWASGRTDAAPQPRAMPRELAWLTGDSVRAEQWQITMLDAEKAWKQSTGAGVTVAVIDSGVAADHADLRGQVLPGVDYVDLGGDGSNDEAGHGTTVAALIAGVRDDDEGVVGLAPDAKILPVRVLDAKNQYKNPQLVADAVVWAVDQGAKVINLSLGSDGNSGALSDAIDYAFARDVVVVACVGNTIPGSTGVWHPAREPGVIAVSAVNADAKPWWGSLNGPATVLSAPGSDLLGAQPKGYVRVSGTSFAAPLVSATAALVRAKYPQMSAANVVQRLIGTARDEGPKGRDAKYGFGIVDPVAALSAKVPDVVANPLDNTPPPGNAAFGPAGVPMQSTLPSNRAAVSATPSAAAAAGPPVTSQPPAPASAVETAVTAEKDQTPVVEPKAAHSRSSPGEPWGLAVALGVFIVLAGGVLAYLRRL